MALFTLAVGLTIGVALRGVGVMLLWNWVMPSVFNVAEISFFEGVGMFLLAAFIFGNLFDRKALLGTDAKKKVEKEKAAA